MTNSPTGLLVMAVVQEQDLEAATKALNDIDIRVTFFSSAGGFLGRRNSTLLIGLPVARAGEALDALRAACRQRTEYMTLPLEGTPMPMPAPVPVTVGGATVFALPVERIEEI
jgi:uncharacterized protein YaaQ